MSDKPSYLADFDSASAMLVALARFLHGQDFPLMGAMPKWSAPGMKVLASVVNRLPRWAQEQVYIWSGWLEAISPQELHRVKEAALTDWVVGLYPKRRYPAIAIGSSNGAATHLWAALGIPWLPQTFLVPVSRSDVHPDRPVQELEWGRHPARLVLDDNPDLQLHHMQDPVQDRLMVRRMSYFRFKKLTLGGAYRRFIDECLEPGGTIFLVDCRFSWPVTDCGDRHLFQFGALGGATVEEMHRGGPRVSEYLRRYDSSATRWSPPSPDYTAPEAEWGFAPALGKDVETYAFDNGYVLRRMVFTHPEQMSPLVADLHRWWNHRRGLSATRLLVDSFILMEPYWTLRTGSIPYWMVFNTEGSLANLRTYLTDHSFEEIYLTLFSHGVDSIGLPSIADWRQAMSVANASRFLGVDQRAFPRDFAVFIRYYFDLLKSIRARHPLPQSLTLAELDTFLGEHGHHFDISWAVEPKQLTA
jgi:hypothetical protein